MNITRNPKTQTITIQLDEEEWEVDRLHPLETRYSSWFQDRIRDERTALFDPSSVPLTTRATQIRAIADAQETVDEEGSPDGARST